MTFFKGLFFGHFLKDFQLPKIVSDLRVRLEKVTQQQ